MKRVKKKCDQLGSVGIQKKCDEVPWHAIRAQMVTFEGQGCRGVAGG